MTCKIVFGDEVAPHRNHPFAHLSPVERWLALEELIGLATTPEMISDSTQKNQGDLSCPSSPCESVPTSG